MIFKEFVFSSSRLRRNGKACLRIILSKMNQMEVLWQTGRKNKFFKEICFKNKNPDGYAGGTPHALEELRLFNFFQYDYIP